MMLRPEVFEEYGKKRLKEILEKGERPVIIAGFIDPFGDSEITSCSICHVPVWVRPWVFKAMVDYDLKAVCLCCADPFEVKGQVMMDFAKIESGQKLSKRSQRTST